MSGRKCKCHITGEVGTTDTFIKIGRYYYKSQEIYDKEQKRVEDYKALVDYICREFMGYGDGQPFPPYLPKKLKELSYYDNEVILETFKQCHDTILYFLNTKVFANDSSKLSYMFAIVKNNIADVNTMFQHKKEQEVKARRISIEQVDLNELGTKQRGKDISSYLEDDEF